MTATAPLKERTGVSPKDTWNVEALYDTLSSWDKELGTLLQSKQPPYFRKLATYRGRLHEGPAIIKSALEEILKVGRTIEKLHTYAHLRHDEDLTHDDHKSAYQKILSLSSDFDEETSWFQPELLALPSATVDAFLRDPLLTPYLFYLEKILRMRPHTLSADNEELLAMAGKPLQAPPKAFSALNNADLKFGKVADSTGKEHDLTHGLYALYLRSPDRELRKNAFETLHGQYLAFENTLGELLYGEMQSHVFSAKARKFSSCLDAALFPKKIPLSVYETLIKTVREKLPSLHRYMDVRKKILGVDQLHLYDLYVPLVPKVEIMMSYEEAENAVVESAAPLGEEYTALLKQGLLKDRWVDRYENKNKRSGAYSSGCYDSFPYILMNFRGLLRDTFTLAHEAGHSMHSLLSRTNQPYVYSHYPIFVAEVASTFNEELLMDYLLKQRTKKEERLFLVNEALEDIRATFFRQTMFAEFELTMHKLVEEGTPLTPTLLKEIYTKLNTDYFGPNVVIDAPIAIEWARIPHFYYNFYVYQYATGISAATCLSERVLHKEPRALEQYLAFLKSGGSLYPIDLLKLAGIDMTTAAPIEAIIRKFDSLVSELATLST